MRGELCDHCRHEKAMGRCWRLTCPVNGGSYKLMRLVRPPDDEPKKEGRLL